MKKLILTSALATIIAAPFAQAADGLLEPTSTGTSVVTITKQDAVQITDVDDLAFGSLLTATANLNKSDDICIFSSTTGYNIKLTSATGTGVFELDSGTEKISYTVAWGGTSVTEGAVLTGQSGNNSDATCGGVLNANLSVTIVAADFNNASPGAYTDTITMLIDAE